MSRIKEIKAAQIAAAKERGEDTPHVNPKSVDAVVSNKPLNRLQKIKLAQIAAAEEKGEDHPYMIGVDMASGKDTSVVSHAPSTLENYQMALAIDLEKIKAATDIPEKIRIKATVLQTYTDFTNDYIEQGHNYPNDVAVQVMIWQLDAGDIEDGLNLAFVLIEQNQRMPQKFDRNMETFICDFVYDWSSEQLKAKHSASPYLDSVVAVAADWDIPVVCLSKVLVMLAKHKEQAGDYQRAFDLCVAAETINPEKAGVKGLKANCEKHLKPA